MTSAETVLLVSFAICWAAARVSKLVLFHLFWRCSVITRIFIFALLRTSQNRRQDAGATSDHPRFEFQFFHQFGRLPSECRSGIRFSSFWSARRFFRPFASAGLLRRAIAA